MTCDLVIGKPTVVYSWAGNTLTVTVTTPISYSSATGLQKVIVHGASYHDLNGAFQSFEPWVVDASSLPSGLSSGSLESKWTVQAKDAGGQFNAVVHVDGFGACFPQSIILGPF